MENTNQLAFKSLVKDAWRLTKGMKSKIWSIIIFAAIVAICIYTPIEWLEKTIPDLIINRGWLLLKYFLLSFPFGIFTGSLMMMCVELIRGKSITYRTWEKYRIFFIPLGFISFISAVLESLPNLLYPVTLSESTYVELLSSSLSVIFTFLLIFSWLIVIDKKANPIKASILSIQLILKNFKISVLLYLFGLATLACSLFFLLIPLIWTVPFSFMLIALFYVRITQQLNN